MGLKIVAVDLRQARAFVLAHHRHHKPPNHWKFGMGVVLDGKLVGVAMVGRPVSRVLDNGRTLEVIRCCTDGTKNAASLLYAACWRAAKALGYERLITYTLESEAGTSLVAAGWKKLYRTRGGTWDTPARRRQDKAPICRKFCWQSPGYQDKNGDQQDGT